MNYVAYFLASIPLSFPVLWIAYLATMNLKRAKEAGTLDIRAKVIGYPFLYLFAYPLDAYCNTLFFSLLLWELPQWQNRELLVTDRLKRTRRTGTGRRLAIAEWFVPLLNPYDQDHI